MASYSLEVKRSAAKELAGLPKPNCARVTARIQALAHDPRPVGSEQLSGQERYRVRQGDYGILYEVKDDVLIVTVVKVGRREVYRR